VEGVDSPDKSLGKKGVLSQNQAQEEKLPNQKRPNQQGKTPLGPWQGKTYEKLRSGSGVRQMQTEGLQSRGVKKFIFRGWRRGNENWTLSGNERPGTHRHAFWNGCLIRANGRSYCR